MLDDVLACLRCPVCTDVLRRDGRALRCPGGHTFDVARQGYVSLLTGDARLGTADTAAMVAARADFLAAGHYGPLAAALADAARRLLDPATPGCVLDVGAGTGHALAAVLDALPSRAGLALDLSKHASRRAARAHPRIGAVTADAWRRLPLADDAAALVLDVFAPRTAAELHRVLHPAGVLLVVTPTDAHLRGLVEALGLLRVDPRKGMRLAEQLDGRFVRFDARELTFPLRLRRDDVRRLAGMGPSAHHLDTGALEERLGGLGELVTAHASVTIAAYRPVGGRRPAGEPPETERGAAPG